MKALVLSGGGVKGAFQVGVLKKLMIDDHVDYDIICGVSVGGINAAGLGLTQLGQPSAAILRLESLWLDQVSTASIYKRWFPFGRLHSLWERSIYDSGPLSDLLKKNIDLDLIRTSRKTISVGAVSLDTGKQKFITQQNDDFVDWVLASSSFPVFFLPIEIDGTLWSDGGIKNMTPLNQAIRLGATDIDVIMCSNIEKRKHWSRRRTSAIPDQVTRTLEIVVDQIIDNDIELCRLKNELARYDDRFRHVKLRVFMPDKQLCKNSLNFDENLIRDLIDVGYAAADSYVIFD